MSTEAPKVVSLRGGEIKVPYEPRPAVIETLEELLEMARSGEVVGIAAVCVHGDEATTFRLCGQRSRAMLGTVEMVKIELCEELR